jgi:trimethylamine--corrinoid protein Co-methyltransferase
MQESSEGAPARRSGRQRNLAARSGGEIVQRPWRQPASRLPPVELLSAEELERIHQTSLRILEEIGVDFLSAEARDIVRAAGGRVAAGSERVYLDRALVEALVAQAPPGFRLHARNPAHDLQVGGRNIFFCCVASPPNCQGQGQPRHAGTLTDYRDFLKLGQQLNIIHAFGGYPVEPSDVDPRVRHLVCLSDLATMTDKIFHAYALGRQRILDALEIVKIMRGIDEAQLDREPSFFTVVNSSSPLRYDKPMLEGAIEMARRNQPVAYTPFTLAGAMAPITLAGALAQQNAEVLAGIAFTQMVRPGAPCLYGAYTSNVDMKTGAPAFGTPEYAKTTLISGQLARRYRLPYRASDGNAANAPDAQSVYESAMSLWSAMLAQCNLMMHAAGWLEGGLSSSFEKLVIDAEMLQMIAALLDPTPINDETLALEAIREVGPGGHFFGTPHTLERYETAFYVPLLSDWSNFGRWQESGAPDALARAGEIARRLIESYEPPPLAPERAAALAAFVARRTAEGGASAD